MAAPIGVSPLAVRTGGWKLSIVVKSHATCTWPPNVTMATSTRVLARVSAASVSLKVTGPSFRAAIGGPSIDPDVSSNNTQGERGSGFSAKLLDPNAGWAAE